MAAGCETEILALELYMDLGRASSGGRGVPALDRICVVILLVVRPPRGNLTDKMGLSVNTIGGIISVEKATVV